MNIQILLLVSASILAYRIWSQSIAASYSLIDGSPWTGTTVLASYPPARGTFGANNRPGGRSFSKIVVYNNLIYSFHGKATPGNDVWAFNITDDSWAWMAGNSTSALPMFGTGGTSAAALDTPGYRWGFGGDIHRQRKEYVLFGGFSGVSTRGDLWTYILRSNIWTWRDGRSTLNESPVYNTIGASTTSTTPGARLSPACVVDTLSGEFLLYGGSSNQTGQIYSDVWAYTFVKARWTWISGSSIANVGALVEFKGVWSTGYFPASRDLSDFALSTESNIIYLFGGATLYGALNDLWAFKPRTRQWAWISGSTDVKDPGACGIVGYPSRNNSPGARNSHSLVYHSHSGLLIMFGGTGFGCSGASGTLSDTWAFNTSSSEWAWIAGSSTQNNTPKEYAEIADQSGSAMAVDSDTSAIFMFGGRGYFSQSVLGNVDYLWAANVAYPSSHESSSLAINTQSPFSSAFSRSLSERVVVDSSVSNRVSNASSNPLSLSSQTLVASSSETLASMPLTSYAQVTSDYLVLDYLEYSSSKRLADFKSSTTRGSQYSKAGNVTRLWSIKYRLLTALLVALLIITNFLAFTLSRTRNHEGPSKTTGISTTGSGFQTDSSTTSNTNGQTTLSSTSIGVYIPGGLQVDGIVAYRTKKKIARGGGGSVWLATALDPALKEYGETVIVKIPNAAQMNERAIALFHQEIALMNAFKQYQNIAKLLGYSEKPYSTIVKYYPNGSLSTWISSAARTLGQALAFLKDISVGISILHYNGIIHCDLKPDNVLIDYDSRLIAVIADFGISRIVTKTLLKVGAYHVQLIKGASLAYAAPEAINELRGGQIQMSPTETMARDIYAIGMISAALMNGKNAWK